MKIIATLFCYFLVGISTNCIADEQMDYLMPPLNSPAYLKHKAYYDILLNEKRQKQYPNLPYNDAEVQRTLDRMEREHERPRSIPPVDFEGERRHRELIDKLDSIDHRLH